MRLLSVVGRVKVERVSSRSHPEFQAEKVRMSLPHIIEAAGAELPSTAYVGALPSTLIAGNSLTKAP